MHYSHVDVILESFTKVKNVVIIVTYRRSVLLGLSNANDSRKDKWCFVGGHIKSNENPFQAAVRETKEESNIEVKCTNDFIIRDNTIYIRAESKVNPKHIRHNNEFKAMGFFDKKGIKSLKLAANNKEILNIFNIL